MPSMRGGRHFRGVFQWVRPASALFSSRGNLWRSGAEKKPSQRGFFMALRLKDDPLCGRVLFAEEFGREG